MDHVAHRLVNVSTLSVVAGLQVSISGESRFWVSPKGDLTHVRTAPFYPRANGKIELWRKTIKGDGIRPAAPQTREEGLRVVGQYVEHYNGVRLHSAIGYVTAERLPGRPASGYLGGAR